MKTGLNKKDLFAQRKKERAGGGDQTGKQSQGQSVAGQSK